MQKLIGLLGLMMLASGCAGVATLPVSSASSLFTTPNSANLEIRTQTEIQLASANFTTVKTNVVGQSRGFALLGVITMYPARFQTAMNRLYAHAEMEPGRPQTLANMIMEKSSIYLIPFSVPRLSVRGDVVEFAPPRPVLIIPESPGGPGSPSSAARPP